MRTVVALVAAVVLLGGCNWLQFGGDPTHSGVGTFSQITPQNVKQLHQIWHVPLPHGELTPSQPLFVGNVATPSGTRNMLVVNSDWGGLYALDPVTGATIWQVQPPTPYPTPPSCTTQGASLVQCNTQGSPAIDADTQRVYSYVPATGQVHQYALGTGQEITGNGWPERVTLKPDLEKVTSDLTIAKFSGTKYLYVTTASFAQDFGDYQGHVTTINLATGAQHVFNAMCSNQAVHFVAAPGSPDCPKTEAGIWARGGAVPDTATGKVYVSTGNGTFDPLNHDWGESVLALNPDGTGNANGDPVDSWTPTNPAELDSFDGDIGSTNPTLLPALPGSRFPHLGLQGGKQGLLYFLNLDNLSGQGGPGHRGGETPWSPEPVPQGGQVLGHPITWTDPQGRLWVLITTRYDLSYTDGTGGMSGSLVLTDPAGNPYLSPQWVIHGSGESDGIGPVTRSGVMFTTINHAIIAVNATTGQGLWLAPLGGNNHMETPTVVGNAVYVTDEFDGVTAFSL